jgi:hypothetical protein
MFTHGHLHHVFLEERDGHAFLALEYGTEYRETCEQQRSHKRGTPTQLRRMPTSVIATPAIVSAFNQGDATYLRTDTTARATRLALFDFLAHHQNDDPYCEVIESDLRRHAAIPLCDA